MITSIRLAYFFSGKVFPERANVNVSALELTNLHNETNVKFHVLLYIDLSQISAKVEILEGQTDIYTFKNIIEDSIRMIVDILGYCWGVGYDIEISSCITPDEKHVVFGVGIPELENQKSQRPLQPSEMIALLPKSMYLSKALADLRESIRSPHTALFCYRAVECVRMHFHEDKDTNRNPSWARLRENLNLTEDWIMKRIGDYATDQRHADDLFLPGELRTRIMIDTWQIIDRFCYFLSKGSQPLDKNKWPVFTQV